MDFNARFEQQRQAQDDEQRARERLWAAKKQDEAAAAQEVYRELTPAFIAKAKEIGLDPVPVVASKLIDRKVSWLGSKTEKVTVFSHTVGPGWVVREHYQESSIMIAGFYPSFLVMREGDWINLNESGWSRYANGVNLRGLPPTLKGKDTIVLETWHAGVNPRPRPIVSFTPGPYRNMPDVLVAELIAAEKERS